MNFAVNSPRHWAQVEGSLTLTVLFKAGFDLKKTCTRVREVSRIQMLVSMEVDASSRLLWSASRLCVDFSEQQKTD